MEEGVVPDDWRCANVTPIFKKGTVTVVIGWALEEKGHLTSTMDSPS